MTNGDGQTRDHYVRTRFGGNGASRRKRQQDALEKALDIRKFEIDLYWRRTAYFWAFIAATFGGYIATTKNGVPSPLGLNYAISCVGLVLSVAWYCVNKASKAWQENWEKHVDILEDEVIGPQYKTVNNFNRYRRRRAFLSPVEPYFFSVSKINQLLSFFVMLVWVALMVRTILIHFAPIDCLGHTGPKVIIATVFTLAAVFVLVKYGKTRSRSEPEVNARVRHIEKMRRQDV